MQLKDWFHNGYSRDELEKIYQDFYQTQHQSSPTLNRGAVAPWPANLKNCFL